MPAARDSSSDRVPLALLIALAGVFIWSGIGCHDRFTWFLEVFPVIFGVPLLVVTYRRFRFTNLVYVLIALHAVILMVGGHYTYALMPWGLWARDALHLARNHYDRVGHVAQGFVPAMIARELLLRTSGLGRGKWLLVLVVCAALSVSALYELLEVGVAMVSGEAADAFLATQGDPLDTQRDMACALVAAIIAPLLLGRWQDRQLRAMETIAASPEETMSPVE